MKCIAGHHRGARRSLPFLLVAVVFLLVGASQAGAATRYAVPGGNTSSSTCASKADNCSLENALEGSGVAAGDEIIVSEGTYVLGSNTAFFGACPLNVHGEDGHPRPAIISNTGGSQWTMFTNLCAGDATVFRHLYIENQGGYALGFIGAFSSGPPLLVEDVDTVGTLGGIQALLGASTIRDTNAFTSTPNGTAIYSSSNASIRNVTAVSTADGGIALQQHPQSSSTEATAVARNSIFDGGPNGGSDIETLSQNCGSGCERPSHVDADFSNYDVVSNCSAGCSITPAGSASNQTAPPQFVDRAGDELHEASGSPTIDAGQASPDNGPADLDGNPRTLGAAPDIGSDEFVPPGTVLPPPPPPPAAPTVVPTTQLPGAFAGLTLTRSVYKVKGKFVTIPISCPAFVTGNCTGNISLVSASKVLVKPVSSAAKKKIKIGKSSFSIPAGTTKNVKVKLTKAALKVIKRTGKLKAVATLTAKANGVTKKSSKKVTLKGKKG